MVYQYEATNLWTHTHTHTHSIHIYVCVCEGCKVRRLTELLSWNVTKWGLFCNIVSLADQTLPSSMLPCLELINDIYNMLWTFHPILIYQSLQAKYNRSICCIWSTKLNRQITFCFLFFLLLGWNLTFFQFLLSEIIISFNLYTALLFSSWALRINKTFFYMIVYHFIYLTRIIQ